MNVRRTVTIAAAAGLAASLSAGLSGCISTAPGHRTVPAPVSPPSSPDDVPRSEQRSRNGNPAFYDVFGKRYFVLPSSLGYVERGVASWYGPGFHRVRTSTGEIYDMYAMTAAHKTLPLPVYARVTNLQNGRSIVVRINDRGPFVGNRIIDLSYSGAAKLDMLRKGTAIVEVRTLVPNVAPFGATPSGAAAQVSAPTAAAAPGADSLFVQAGAFADAGNAERLVQKLRGKGYEQVFIREDQLAGHKLFRVRIGPVPDVARFDQIVAALEHAGINDAHLALD